MSTDLMKRAEELDNLRSKGIADKLTLEEADKIVQVWGTHLEYCAAARFLFGTNIPESFLPYPISIIQGAINKMEAYYYAQGMHDRVKVLEETEMLLIQYTNDEEAIKEFSNKNWQEAVIPTLKDFQKNQIEGGHLVDKKLWKISKSRIRELLE